MIVYMYFGSGLFITFSGTWWFLINYESISHFFDVCAKFCINKNSYYLVPCYKEMFVSDVPESVTSTNVFYWYMLGLNGLRVFSLLWIFNIERGSFFNSKSKTCTLKKLLLLFYRALFTANKGWSNPVIQWHLTHQGEVHSETLHTLCLGMRLWSLHQKGTIETLCPLILFLIWFLLLALCCRHCVYSEDCWYISAAIQEFPKKMYWKCGSFHLSHYLLNSSWFYLSFL